MPAEALDALPKRLEVRYARRGSVIIKPDDENIV